MKYSVVIRFTWLVESRDELIDTPTGKLHSLRFLLETFKMF